MPFKHLISLNVANTGIKAKGFIKICSFKTLTHLNLSDTKGAITHKNITNLNNLPKLTYLNLANTITFTDQVIKNLNNHSTLDHLDLSHHKTLNDEKLFNFKDLKNIRTISINFCSKVTIEGLGYLLQMSNIISIYCEGINLKSIMAESDKEMATHHKYHMGSRVGLDRFRCLAMKKSLAKYTDKIFTYSSSSSNFSSGSSSNSSSSSSSNSSSGSRIFVLSNLKQQLSVTKNRKS